MADFAELHRYDAVTTDAMRARARDLVEKWGTNGAAARLGVSRSTLASLLAGLPISKGSHGLIELSLIRAGQIEV
jgi:triphosphoribosyl-dephospho-CoA synthetase